MNACRDSKCVTSGRDYGTRYARNYNTALFEQRWHPFCSGTRILVASQRLSCVNGSEPVWWTFYRAFTVTPFCSHVSIFDTGTSRSSNILPAGIGHPVSFFGGEHIGPRCKISDSFGGKPKLTLQVLSLLSTRKQLPLSGSEHVLDV